MLIEFSSQKFCFHKIQSSPMRREVRKRSFAPLKQKTKHKNSEKFVSPSPSELNPKFVRS